jgi:putative intracellular protease/amidase
MAGRVLAMVSNYGYWGIELAAPLDALQAAGYDVVFSTPRGERPQALPPSYDPDYVDPPLNARVTTPEDAARVKELEQSPQLDGPLDLSAWMPARPYHSHPDFLRAWERYHALVLERQEEMGEEYAALLLVGGSGPILDMVNNHRVHDVILSFHRLGRPIAAICYGVACLAMARDVNERRSLLRGKHVTGHCLEYDYQDGTGFLGTDLNMGPPPYCLEYVLRDAVGPDGEFHGNFGKPTSVVVDYPFITARSLHCSREFGQRLVDVLDRGVRRYGW